jgi:WD40 repeat protein
MIDVKLLSSPYIGLVPFSERDAAFFFGRERERKIISANLATHRLTLLYGPSGVGKSSVINAGVVHQLRQRAQEQLAGVSSLKRGTADGSLPSAGDYTTDTCAEFGRYRKPVVVIVFSNWIGNPLESLREAILAELKRAVPDLLEIKNEEGLRTLRLTEMLDRLTTSNGGLELLIILDQFEEYFVYHPREARDGRFADEFSRAVVTLDLRAKFLISIREDWLARLDRFRGHIPNLFENSIRIGALDRQGAREAIVNPIEQYNKLIREPRSRFDGMRMLEVAISPEFVSEALNQFERLDDRDETGLESGAEPRSPSIAPAQLQVVMQHLWGKVKDHSPPKLGLELLARPDTAKQIVESNLRETLEHLSRKEKVTAANLFRFLITESGTKFASTVDGLATRSGRQVSQVRPLLEKLSGGDVRILNQVAPPPGQPNQVHYELTSDVLAAPILAWGQEVFAKQRRMRQRSWSALASLIILFVIITFSAFLRARQQRQAANEQARVVEIERAKAQRALNAVRQLDKAVPYSKAVLRGHGAKVTSAVFTPDGKVLTASRDGSAILWDIESRDPIREFNKDESEEKQLISAAINTSGETIVTAQADGMVTLWDRASGTNTQLRDRAGKHVTAISFNPAGDIIAAANTAGEVLIWNTASGKLIKDLPANGAAIMQIAFSPSGAFLAAASDDHTVRIWRGTDWNLATILKGHTGRINGVAFSPDETSIATASADTTVRVWTLSTGASYRVLFGHAQSVNSVDFDSTGTLLLTASDDTTARIWHIETSKSIQLVGHTDKVLSASFSPNGQQVATASRDTVARIWSASTGQSLVALRGHLSDITYVSYSRDGRYLLTASEDATARVWYSVQSANFEIEQPTLPLLRTITRVIARLRLGSWPRSRPSVAVEL